MGHKLNTLPFYENGKQRTVCVEDGHGSPNNPNCPRCIAGYCRGQNLRYTHPCWNQHPPKPTLNARPTLTPIRLDSAMGVELTDKFMASAPFHNGRPTIVEINAIHNETLWRCHEEYRKYLITKHMEEPAVQDLYHGTNNDILDIVYHNGLQPPADFNASDACPVSGGKGLTTSLCNNTCQYCSPEHKWNRCHMYGLGVYLADMAQKSHRYVREPCCGDHSMKQRRTYYWQTMLGGRFRDIEEEFQERFEDVYQQNDLLKFCARGWNCTMDFKRMLQINLSTGRERQVQRVELCLDQNALAESVPEPPPPYGGARVYSMLRCRVLLGNPYLIEGNLLSGCAMHDMCWCQNPSDAL